MNINDAIKAYSYPFNNRIQPLREYCSRCSYSGSVEELAKRIDQMQGRIFDVLWSSEKKTMTAQEIEKLSRAFLAVEEPDVNDTGFNGLMQWVMWMAWHEGILQ